MNMKIALVLLFAFIATSQAGYAILTSYSDSSCSPENVIAQFYTNDPAGCDETKKRSIEQLYCGSAAGVNFTYDYSNCNNNTIPSIPSTWQVLQLSTESTCNASSAQTYPYTSLIAAPKDFSDTSIAVAAGTNEVTAAKTSLSCDTSSGNLTVNTCILFPGVGYRCIGLNLPNDVCMLDNTNTAYYGLQTTCTATPVSAPVATVPVSSPVFPPISGPIAENTPVNTLATTPVNAPTAKASSAAVVHSSIALLCTVALL